MTLPHTQAPRGLIALLVALFVMLALPVAGTSFVLPTFAEDEMPADEKAEEAPEGEEDVEEVEEAPELPWVHDIVAARKQAKAEGKDLFINFTGSDWCRYCIQLEGEVFGHAEFIEATAKDFVFLFLDFPNDPELKAKVVDQELSDKLKKDYAIGGYPTIIFATADGHPYGRLGYQPGGPTPWLEQLAEKKAAGEKVKKLLESKTDEEALKAAFPVLVEAELLEYPEYTWTVEAIEKLDPKGELELLPLVRAVQEQKAFEALLPKSRGEMPDFPALATFLLESKYMKGPDLLNNCVGVAKGLVDTGGDPKLAKALLERIKDDPIFVEEPRAKQFLDMLTKSVDELLNPPADDEDEDEDDEQEDGDDDEEHDDDMD